MDSNLIAAIDVQYDHNDANAGVVLFDRWRSSAPIEQFTFQVKNCEAYQPGKFYKREMPVILASLDAHLDSIATIVVDGHVDLDVDRPGLGRILYLELEKSKNVIGVAKSRFAESEIAIEVLRGESSQPLFVTSAGIDPIKAAEHIKSMCGSFRIPTLLKLADSIARGNAQ